MASNSNIASPQAAAAAAEAPRTSADPQTETVPGAGPLTLPPPTPSLMTSVGQLLLREPVLVVSLIYALVSIMGMWSHYWFYRRLGVPILDYLQSSDFFLIGIRQPDYFLVVVGVLVFHSLASAPYRWARRHPERVAEKIQRRPWLRLVYGIPADSSGRFSRIFSAQSQMLAFGLLLPLQYLWIWATWNANEVRAGRDDNQSVNLTLAGTQAPLPGSAQLLGTTSAYVFVWWPQTRRVEALPIANLARIESALPVNSDGVPTQSSTVTDQEPAAGAALLSTHQASQAVLPSTGPVRAPDVPESTSSP